MRTVASFEIQKIVQRWARFWKWLAGLQRHGQKQGTPKHPWRLTPSKTPKAAQSRNASRTADSQHRENGWFPCLQAKLFEDTMIEVTTDELGQSISAASYLWWYIWHGWWSCNICFRIVQIKVGKIAAFSCTKSRNSFPSSSYCV